MNLIAHTGLTADTYTAITAFAVMQNFSLEAFTESEADRALQHIDKFCLFIIGEEITNPVILAQKIYKADKNLSILIVARQKEFQKLKQTLQFSPFIGPTVKTVANGGGEEKITPIIQDLAQRTEQRRSYVKLKSINTPVTDFSTPIFDQIKADYLVRVLEEAPIGALLINQNGQILTANPYALQLFHKTEKDVINTPVQKLFPKNLQEEITAFIKNGYLQKQKERISISISGELKHLEILLADATASNSNSHKICIINDVTESVEAQQKIEEHLREIEAINIDLKRTNTDLDTFVYAASHDLKSPILNIEGLVNMLEEELEEPTAEVLTILKHIYSSVNRFKRTVTDMSEAIKLQKSKIEETEAQDIAKIIEEIKLSIGHEIESTEARVETDLAEAPEVFISRSNLKSVLYNLISNAIKYRSPDRAPLIKIKSGRKDGCVFILVQDNGLGLAEENLEHIFSMFKRFHAHVEGTGMGLFIVKRIIEKEGGEIFVKSKKNVGTSFELQFKNRNCN